MSGEVRIGTSGWSYPSGRGTWNGVFYPAPRPRGFDELRHYAECFDTVEVNSTFYRMPDPGMTRRWLDRTPSGFLFSIKLYQKFTHPDMYLGREGVSDWTLSRGDVDEFRVGIEPLAHAGRLAAILIQFPPSFHGEVATRDYLTWLLDALAGYPLAVELRHRTWSDDAASTRARLSAQRAAWVLIDEPKFKDSIRQDEGGGALGFRRADVPGVHNGPADLTYVRLHGRNAAAWWEHAEAEDRYDYLYSRDELTPYADLAQQAATAGRRVLMYMNNHFSAKSVANAAVLKHVLGQPLPGEYPRSMIARYPELERVVTTSGLPL